MVRGLDVFREHFAAHAGQFVLIGGTAATLAMESAGLEFRATRDLDIGRRCRRRDLRPKVTANNCRYQGDSRAHRAGLRIEGSDRLSARHGRFKPTKRPYTVVPPSEITPSRGWILLQNV